MTALCLTRLLELLSLSGVRTQVIKVSNNPDNSSPTSPVPPCSSRLTIRINRPDRTGRPPERSSFADLPSKQERRLNIRSRLRTNGRSACTSGTRRLLSRFGSWKTVAKQQAGPSYVLMVRGEKAKARAEVTEQYGPLHAVRRGPSLGELAARRFIPERP